MVLDWFVGPDRASSTLKESEVLTESKAETNQNLISVTSINKTVDINIIRQFLV